LEDRVVPAGATPGQHFVTQAYQDLTGKTIDKFNLTAWNNLFSQGYFPQQVAFLIETSPDGLTKIVNDTAQRFVGRAPTPFEMGGSYFLLATGGSLEQLEDVWAGSDQFFLANGGTNLGFLIGLHQTLFGATQPIASDFLTGWSQVLDAGFSRTQVADFLITQADGYFSNEVSLIFQKFHVTATATELSVWAGLDRQYGALVTTSAILGSGIFSDYLANSQNSQTPVTATALTSSFPDSAPVLGTEVDFTATVSPNARGPFTAGGTVTFTDLSDGNKVLGQVGLDAKGQAILKTTALAGGTHTIVATYSGDANFFGSTSDGFKQKIGSKATTTSLSLSTSEANENQPLSFTAFVSPNKVGNFTATGSVAFTVTGPGITNPTPTSVALGTNGQATLQVPAGFATPGNYTVSALYTSGDGNFTADTVPATQPLTVSANTHTPTSVTVAASPTTVNLGGSVTLTATVLNADPNSAGFGTPNFGSAHVYDGGATVSFTDEAGDKLGTAPVDNTGHASVTTAMLGGGAHTIQATYNPVNNTVFQEHTSTGAETAAVTVNAATATVRVAVTSPASPNLGDAVTFKATVVPTVAGFPLSGSVAFYDGDPANGGAFLGTGLLTVAGDGSGTATFTTDAAGGPTGLSAGGHTIFAVYQNDNNYTGRASTSVTVGKATPTLSLTVSVTPGSGKVSISVSLSSIGKFVPSGGITVTIDGSPASSLNPTLSAANHTIVASYGGDSNFNSTSATSTLTYSDGSDADPDGPDFDDPGDKFIVS
jgi:hypothetical protein